ncbi:MAG: type II secretion system F family protein [Pseudomonadota bacterium]
MSDTLFQYKARDTGGARRSGLIAAASEGDAAHQLERAGLTPLTLAPGRAARRARATLDHRAAAMRRLASLTAAAAPLDRALKLAGGTQSAGPLFSDLALTVAGGKPLSDAMADWPGDFADAEIALIASGEATGSLPRATAATATLMERRAAGRRTVASALAYPAFVVIAALLAGAVFIGFAQPRFEEVLRATGADISPTTDWFFAASGILRDFGGPILLALLVLGLVAVMMGGTEGGRRAITGIAHRLPLIGPLLSDRAMEAYCGALGAMLGGGAPVPEAARLSARMLGAPALITAGRNAAEGVIAGRAFSAALRDTGQFPDTMTAFVEIGEETGGLAPLMDNAAQHFGQEAEARARRLAAVAAPAATAILGLLIGVGAYLMMTAVLDVYDAAL